jgi:threonine dehydratase
MNIDMIHAAAERLKGHARTTPMLNSPFLDEIAGRRLYVKAECLQHTGSFKFRGAWSAISTLDEDARKRGVIAYSSGNHGQGIPFAAKHFNTPAVVVMPSDAPEMKIANTRALGAEVILYDRENEDRDDIGAKLANERSLTLIKPFDNPLVIAGQGTTGLEIADQCKTEGVENADVLVCCGGGGLTSGIALALEEHAPGLRARPIEPEDYDDVCRSLASGAIQRNNLQSGGICDAIVTPQPGDLTFPIMKRLCGPGIAVTEDEVLMAMAHIFARLKIVAEPGGAVAVAAALFHADEIQGDAVVAVVSGGNVDAKLFTRALATL